MLISVPVSDSLRITYYGITCRPSGAKDLPLVFPASHFLTFPLFLVAVSGRGCPAYRGTVGAGMSRLQKGNPLNPPCQGDLDSL